MIAAQSQTTWKEMEKVTLQQRFEGRKGGPSGSPGDTGILGREHSQSEGTGLVCVKSSKEADVMGVVRRRRREGDEGGWHGSHALWTWYPIGGPLAFVWDRNLWRVLSRDVTSSDLGFEGITLTGGKDGSRATI